MLAVLGDIGGTNVRLALAEYRRGTWRLHDPISEPAANHSGVTAAIARFLGRTGARPEAAAIAIAGPVSGGAVRQTNLPWDVTELELVEILGLRRAVLLNDFAAIALATPTLAAKDVAPLGGPAAPPGDGPIAFLGPGTGLGVAALVRNGESVTIVASEGSHATFGPATDLEAAVVARLVARLPRVTYETLISGPGLQLLHACLAEIEGRPAAPLGSGEILARAQDESDPVCARAVDLFCGALGGFAGDVALMFNARGGVYLAGGVAVRMRRLLERSAFRARFEAKAPHTAYMATIPTTLITDPFVALRGAAASLAQGPVGLARSRNPNDSNS
jgi:glucokinase